MTFLRILLYFIINKIYCFLAVSRIVIKLFSCCVDLENNKYKVKLFHHSVTLFFAFAWAACDYRQGYFCRVVATILCISQFHLKDHDKSCHLDFWYISKVSFGERILYRRHV